MVNRKIMISVIISVAMSLFCSCSKSPAPGRDTINRQPLTVPVTSDVDFWLTKNDQSALLQKQNAKLVFGNNANTYDNVVVDTTQTFQTIDGFGFALNGGSAYVINQLGASEKTNLLKELFGNEENSIGISYLRISIGASDLNATVFSYDDLFLGETDVSLSKFSLAPDETDLIPLLKEILLINPAIKIMATPWSAPAWMKDNNKTIGGISEKKYFEVYAQYFVKYIRNMKSNGISIDAITPQNEPLNPDNNPSLVMTAQEELNFIKNSLRPAFRSAGIVTKIIAYDHNCDHPDYPLLILNDPEASAFVNGAAFHLYTGDIGALSQVHQAFPDKALYFTEQWTSSAGTFGGDLKWHLKNVIIGSMRNWSRTALEWNLANDPSYNPHTPGGCTQCKGALTIGSEITRNVGYYTIAHASKFVPAGSVRIGSNNSGNLQTVAFKTPAGRKALIVENDGSGDATFNISVNNKWTQTTLTAGAVGTYLWN